MVAIIYRQWLQGNAVQVAVHHHATMNPSVPFPLFVGRRSDCGIAGPPSFYFFASTHLLNVCWIGRVGRLLVLSRPAHASRPYGRPAPRAPAATTAPRTPSLDLGEATAAALSDLYTQLALMYVKSSQSTLGLRLNECVMCEHYRFVRCRRGRANGGGLRCNSGSTEEREA